MAQRKVELRNKCLMTFWNPWIQPCLKPVAYGPFREVSQWLSLG
jgi:hypothetical protein